MSCSYCEEKALNKCDNGCGRLVCLKHSEKVQILHYGTAVSSVSGSNGNIRSTSSQFVSAVENKQYCLDCKVFHEFLGYVDNAIKPEQSFLIMLQCAFLCCCCSCCTVPYLLNGLFRKVEKIYPDIIAHFKTKQLFQTKHQDWIPNIKNHILNKCEQTSCKQCATPVQLPDLS